MFSVKGMSSPMKNRDFKQGDKMKRLSIALLAMLLLVSLFISCDNSTKALTDQLVEVRLGTGSGRGLDATIDMDDAGIVWHYSAKKVTETQFKYGETNDTELTETVTLSQGRWDFGLWAVKDRKKVYSGTISSVLITRNENGSPVPVVVPVSPYTGDKGYIVLEDVKIHAKTDGETPVEVTPNFASIDGNEIVGFNGSMASSEYTAGSHTVTIAYKGTDGVEYASETIYVTVYSGRTTTVKGFVDETTGSADIGHESTVEIKGIDGGVKSSTASTVTIGVTPSMEKGTDTESYPIQTTVTFPAGSFSNTEAANAALTVNVKPIDSNFSVGAAGSATAVAGIDISLLVDNKPVTEFNEKEVTISTYIAKGLSEVKVYYNGRVIAADTSENDIYNQETGKLEFKTTHFSEFYVGSAKVEAINVDSNTAYTSLQTAINSASNGNTIKLLKEVELEKSLLIKDGRNLTIDMNGFDIHASSKTILISNANVTFAGNGTIYESTEDQLGALVVSGSNTNVSNYTVVTVEKGVTLRGWSGIIIAKDIAGGYNNYGIVINLYGKVIVPGMDTKHNDHTVPGDGLYINGSNKNTEGNVPVINIKGAEITSTGVGIYAAGYAKWNIVDTKITGELSAIEIRAGELTIDGGEYKANAKPTASEGNGSGTTTTGAAIAVAQHTTKLPIDVKILDGKFEGYTAVYELNPQENPDDAIGKVRLSISGGEFVSTNEGEGAKAIESLDCKGFITGGTFSTDPSAYVADGFTAVKSSENSWVVGKNIIQIHHTFSDGNEELAFCADCYNNPGTEHSGHNKYLNIANGVAEVPQTGAWMAFKDLDWANKAYQIECELDLSDLEEGCFVAFDSGEMVGWQDMHLGFNKSSGEIVAYNTLFTNQLNDTKKLGNIGANVHVSYTYSLLNDSNTLNILMTITDGTNSYKVEKNVNNFSTTADLCWDVYTADGGSDIYAKLDNFVFMSIDK